MSLSDPDNDTVTIKAQYSIDGILWQEATLANGNAGKVKGSVAKLLTWQTSRDFTGDVSKVYFRVRANDSKMEGPWRYLGDYDGGPGDGVVIENGEVKGVRSTIGTIGTGGTESTESTTLLRPSSPDFGGQGGIEGPAGLFGWLGKIFGWISSSIGQIFR